MQALPPHPSVATLAPCPQFLLSVWHDDAYELDFSTPEAQRMVAQVGAFNGHLQDAGAWVLAGGMQPASTSAVVRSADGEATVADGPYATCKEQMGGFWIIDVADRDAALDWAKRAAAACEGPVEVRPLQG